MGEEMKKELKRHEAEELVGEAFNKLMSFSNHDWIQARLFINWLYNEGYRLTHYPDKKIEGR